MQRFRRQRALLDQGYPFTKPRGMQQRFVPEAPDDTWEVGRATTLERFLTVTYSIARPHRQPGSDAERFRDYLAGVVRLPVLEELRTR